MNAKIFLIIFLVIIGILITTMIFSGIYIYSRKNEMNQNWPTYKCKPYVLPFAGILVGPSNVNPTNNFIECMWVMQKGFFGVLMEPFVAIITIIVDILSSLINDIQQIRQMTNYLRESVESIAVDIYQKVYDAYARIARIFIVIETTFKNIFDLFYSLFEVLKFQYYTFMSLWNGPVGGMLRFFCFHPNTPIVLKSGEVKPISHITTNDTIEMGGKVRAVLKFNARNIQMYAYNSGFYPQNGSIIVSGEHWVLENQRWLKVKDSTNTILINQSENPEFIYCLITENNYIKVFNTVFKDYEENNHYNDLIYNTLCNYMNHHTIPNEQNDSTTHLINHKKEYFGSYYYANTNIRMADGTFKEIRNIEIGDLLWNNNPVLAKIIGNPHYCNWYVYKGDIVTGNTLVNNRNEQHQLIKNISISRRILYGMNYQLNDNEITNYCYGLITANNTFETNNTFYFDYEITRDEEIQNYINSVVVH
jgi:hypothetical protein